MKAQRFRKLTISTFIVVHLAALALTESPFVDEAERTRPRAGGVTRQLALGYLNALAIDQRWSVFAKGMARANFSLGARLFYEDGSHEDVLLPTFSDFGWPKRLAYRRYRKLIASGAAFLDKPDGGKAAYRDIARYLARTQASPGRAPVRVELTAFAWPLPLPHRYRVDRELRLDLESVKNVRVVRTDLGSHDFPKTDVSPAPAPGKTR